MTLIPTKSDSTLPTPASLMLVPSMASHTLIMMLIRTKRNYNTPHTLQTLHPESI